MQFRRNPISGLPIVNTYLIIAYMNPASSLYQLQILDTEIKRVETRLTAIQREINGDRRVQSAQEELQQAVQNLRKAQQNLRSIEEKVKEVRDKIQTSDAKLYSGRITNPKELQDLQMDVASNKKRLAAFEDEQLTAMILLEETETTHKLADQGIIQSKADALSDQATLRGEYSQLMKSRERLLSEREVIVGSISPELIRMYDQLIKNKSGSAVTPVEDDACVACGTALQSSTLQAARSPKEITFCPFCKRILFAG